MGGVADHEPAVFVVRVSEIGDQECETVEEHGGSLDERDTVLSEIVARFRLVPFNWLQHGLTIASGRGSGNVQRTIQASE